MSFMFWSCLDLSILGFNHNNFLCTECRYAFSHVNLFHVCSPGHALKPSIVGIREELSDHCSWRSSVVRQVMEWWLTSLVDCTRTTLSHSDSGFIVGTGESYLSSFTLPEILAAERGLIAYSLTLVSVLALQLHSVFLF